MRDGGEAREADADGDDAPRQETGRPAEPAPPTLLGRLRRHRPLASAVALALVATGVAVPLLLAGSDDGPPCQEIPAATRALAENPAAATRALDPGDDLRRFDAVRAILAHEHPCGDGGEVLGAVVHAATRAARPDAPHALARPAPPSRWPPLRTMPNHPRAWDPPSPACSPGTSSTSTGTSAPTTRPSCPPSPPSRPGPMTRAGPMTRTGPLSAVSSPPARRMPTSSTPSPTRPSGPIRRTCSPYSPKDPQAFTILYAPERAWFAYDLERLDGRGSDYGYPVPAVLASDEDVAAVVAEFLHPARRGALHPCALGKQIAHGVTGQHPVTGRADRPPFVDVRPGDPARSGRAPAQPPSTP